MKSILDHPIISSRYFFPRPAPVPEPFMVDCGDADLACIRLNPYKDARTLIHFHGNGEIAGDYLGGYEEALLNLGVNVIFAEYRGYGGSSGEPSLTHLLDDTGRIIEATGLKPEKIILFGRSIGSYYAIHGASLFPQVAGLIIESGIADLGERVLLRVDPAELGCSRDQILAEAKRYFDHQKKLSQYTGPVLLMHTRHDGLVDLDHAQRNHQWAAGPKTLEIFEEGNHNTIIGVNARAYFRTIQDFLARL